MNILLRIFCYGFIFLFIGCIEKEIIYYNVDVIIIPENAATIDPQRFGPLFPGDSISITITPVEGYQFDQWMGTVSSFEPNITIFGTENHQLTASLVETPELSDQVQVYNGPRIDPNPIFAVRLGAKSSIVINKQGEIVTEFENALGNDIEMLPNGEFLGMFKPNNRKDFSFVGSGDILRRVTAHQQTLWEYEIASETELAHHDLELLPNGNVLTIVWEEITTEQAKTLGAQTEHPLYAE
jgi:hypothetical protein